VESFIGIYMKLLKNILLETVLTPPLAKMGAILAEV
jgi:hypothetical protein